jgi:hypothetical protein
MVFELRRKVDEANRIPLGIESVCPLMQATHTLSFFHTNHCCFSVSNAKQRDSDKQLELNWIRMSLKPSCYFKDKSSQVKSSQVKDVTCSQWKLKT